MTHERDFVITDATVRAWADLSGDHNRLHVDPEFAATTPYGRCIAHGPILATLLSEWTAGVAGDAWADGGEISFRFKAPVFHPATISARMELTPAAGGRTEMAVTCTDQDGRTVMTATGSWA